MTAPAWQAMTPELVPRADLPAAIALNAVAFNLARAVGPALGGPHDRVGWSRRRRSW